MAHRAQYYDRLTAVRHDALRSVFVTPDGKWCVYSHETDLVALSVVDGVE